jgi:hypothetical protein
MTKRRTTTPEDTDQSLPATQLARTERAEDGTDAPMSAVWAELAAPIPASAIVWRVDGKPIARDGGHVARFVAYIEANTVRERLDATAPGQWSLSLEPLPALVATSEDGGGVSYAFKARLQVMDVVREDVGAGRDYKAAATDAFKRAAVRFGIGHELYAFEDNWVRVDPSRRDARPLEDPQAAYDRLRRSDGASAPADTRTDAATNSQPANGTAPTPASPASAPSAEPACPKCGGRMWDNRASKRNPRAPDFKCRDRSCDGVVWPGDWSAADAGDPIDHAANGAHVNATNGAGV